MAASSAKPSAVAKTPVAKQPTVLASGAPPSKLRLVESSYFLSTCFSDANSTGTCCGSRLLVSLALLVAGALAVAVRLDSVLKFESIIHEADPW